MYIRYTPLAVLWRMTIAISGTIALIAKLDLFGGSFSLTSFHYFDILITIVTVIYYFVLSFWQASHSDSEKTCLLPSFKGTLMLSMCLIGLVSYFIVNKGQLSDGLEFLWANVLHYTLPVIIVLDWILFDKKGSFKIWFPLIWCIPPFLYTMTVYLAVYAFNGRVGSYGRFPYDFMNMDLNGAATTIAIIITMLLAFIILGFAFFGLDQLPQKISSILPKKKSEEAGG